MAGLIEPTQVGKREDLLDLLTRVDARTTPFSSMVAAGKTPQNTLIEWPVDTFDDPVLGGVLGGEDVASFDNHAADRAILRTYVQKFRTSAKISDDAVDVSNVAGVANEYGEATMKKMVHLKRNIELTYLGSQEHQAESGSDEYLVRSVGTWLKDTANISDQVLYQVPVKYRIPAAQYVTTATASLDDGAIQDVLQSVFDTVGMETAEHYLFAGSVLRRRFTNMLRTEQYADTDSPLAQRQFNYAGSDSTYKATIDIFDGDFGKIKVLPVSYINTAGTVDTDKGYMLDMKCWSSRWHQRPTIKPLPDLGGGPRFFIQARAALACLNPLANAQFLP